MRGWWLEARNWSGEMMAIRECGIKKRAADDYNGAAHKREGGMKFILMSCPLSVSLFASTLMLSTLIASHTYKVCPKPIVIMLRRTINF
jgi:hypothetical protein